MQNMFYNFVDRKYVAFLCAENIFSLLQLGCIRCFLK